FAFIDALKGDYPRHLSLVVPLLRPGGAVAIDNVLLSGAVAGSGPTHWSDEDVLTVRAFNADLLADQGLTATVLSVGDGVAVAVRR
ncbi:MAG: O-methyltransferase, partial [Gaiellales bacterium]